MQKKRLYITVSVFLLLSFVSCSKSVDFVAEPAKEDPPVEQAATKKILFFVPYGNTYYSEYKVVYEALLALGYEVEVRSAASGSAGSYSASGTIEQTADSLAGSSYTEFTTQFQNLFGNSWQSGWNATPATIPVAGRIQDVADMSNYLALVSTGGTGMLAYRLDGSYSAQTGPAGDIAATEVQAAAEKLNALALDALAQGKPIYFQCHGASLPVFFRIPNTQGTGAETLGISLLKNQNAAGYPEAQTTTDYSSLSVTLRGEDRVTISSPNSAFQHHGNADYKIITQRDWYPQTIAHGVRTLANILQTHPSKSAREASVSILILHGGALDTANCAYGDGGFGVNDVPCNYTKTTSELPVDYTHLVDLLTADSANDAFNFSITNINLAAIGGAFTLNDKNSIRSYLNQFKVVIFFKHWSSYVSNELQDALVEYADGGGGVLGLHHAMYNDTNYGGSNTKNILRDELFGVVSEAGSWSAQLNNYNFISTNHGHFISSYGIQYQAAATAAPAAWPATAIRNQINTTAATLQNFAVYDEIYNNMSFVAGQTFGRGVNQINPLFSNDYAAQAAQMHTTGFVKLFNPSSDSSIGKVVFLQAGERRETVNINHQYGQIIRNAAVWLAN